MAFNRSTRFLSSVGRTPPVVGPGTYEPMELFTRPRDPDRLYAFLSSATRNTLSATKDAMSFPGPGAYNVKEVQKHIPGGCSIDFTDSRSKYYVHDGPGPTDYRLPDDLFKRSSPGKRNPPGTCCGGPGSLYLGPPPRSTMANGISVPTHRDANGYDINEFGFLVKNLPDVYEPPLFYDIPREETNFTTLRYKGNFWSQMTGRKDSNLSIGPGPGEYDLNIRLNPGKLLIEKLRESRRMTSKQPRYVEAVFRNNQREGIPAPNAYAIPKSPFDSKEVSCKCEEYIFKPPPFGQGAKRFKNVFHDNPAPGTYDPIKRKCCPGSVIAAPFGSLANRFKSDNTAPIPGPGQYFSPEDGLAHESCKRCKRNYVKAGFNSSASRNSALVASGGPGPNRYPIKMNWKIPRTSVYHSAFKSSTKRFKSIEKPRCMLSCHSAIRHKLCPDCQQQAAADQVKEELLESVAPNAYDVTTAHKACHDSCEFSKCPEDTPFNSKQIRMPKVPVGVDMSVPGPGLTDTRGDISLDVKGGTIPCGRRFSKEATETGPGPQDYCLHPYSVSSILQRHFNVTLGKPRILKDLQQAEISWVRRLKNKKILRTFNKGLIQDHEFCKSRRH